MQRSIAVGVGLMEFPFDGADGFWRWVDLCEAGGIDSIWQTDRLISRASIPESMATICIASGRRSTACRRHGGAGPRNTGDRG